MARIIDGSVMNMVGDKVRELRIEKGMSQQTLSNKLEMLAIYILKEASISLNKKLKEFTLDEKKKLATKLKNLEFNVIGVNDYDKAQIVMGGISLSEIDNKTLELYKHHNIYVVGEVMDIDGECGGFNLSWAWASALNVSDNIVIKEK